MPTVNDMFPTLDYDSLNKGLGFVNFNVDPTQSLNLDLNNSLPQQGINESKDGGTPPIEAPSMEVSETEVPVNRDWEALTRAERIELVKQQASGMPLTAKLNLNLLVKTSSRFQNQGMHKEAGKLIELASDFEKSITVFTRETENEGTSQSTVNVQEDGETLTRTFKDPGEAKAFYDSLAPKIEQVKDLADILMGYNMIEEADSLNKFIEQYAIFNAEIPLLLQGSLVQNKEYGIGRIAWIEGDTYFVIFQNKPNWLDAGDAKGQIIFFEKRPIDNVPSGFYRLLNRPIPYKVYIKEEDKEVVVRTGTLKLVDSLGKIYQVKDYPLGGEFMGTIKMKEDSLQPYEPKNDPIY